MPQSAFALLGTTTAIVSSLNPSAVGQNVTFTATVTGLVITPTGTVTFKDGGVTIGTGNLNGAGQATLVTNTLTAGSHAITAEYGGDLLYDPSNSTVLTQQVNANASSTALMSSLNPSGLGQSVTFTATVTGGAGTPTGTVTFKAGGITIGTGNLNGGGVATFATSLLLPGVHSITAEYGGDATYSASTSTPVSQTVNLGSTSTAVASSLDPSTLGASVTFTATVTGLVITPTGTVTFKNGGATIGTGTLNGAGQATFATSALTVGAHSITAEYGGDLIYGASTSPTLTQDVNQGSSTTALASSLNPSGFGQSITLTATVSGGGVTPTGTVTFKDGAATIGTGAVNGSGQATLSTSALGAGSHSLTAEYGGDSNYTASTSLILTQQINASASTISLTVAPNPVNAGQSATLTATVTGNTPTGYVTFRRDGTVLSVVALTAGTASYSATMPSTGNFSITADYGGDLVNGAATSSPVSLSVGTNPTTVSLASSANPSPYGEPLTFTATVASAGGTPAGNVTFKDGTTSLGSAALGGTGVATFTTRTLAKGSHSITAVYEGNSQFAAATSAVLTQDIGAPIDSVRLRTMQVAVTRLAAQSSGAATASAVDSAIDEAFGGGGAVLRPAATGLRVNFAAEPPAIRQQANDITGAIAAQPEEIRYSSDGYPYRVAGEPRQQTKAPKLDPVRQWFPWADVRLAGWQANKSANDYRGGQINALAGLTYKISPTLLVGLLAGFETLDYRSDSLNGRFLGNGWTAGAYAGWQPFAGLRSTLAVAYSGLTYDGTSGAANAVVAANRLIVSGGVSGTYRFDERLSFEPALRAFALWETQDAYTDTLGTTQDSRSFSAGRVSAGGKLIYRWNPWADVSLSPYAGLYADYHFTRDTEAAVGAASLVTGFSARFVAGVALRSDNGMRVTLGGELGGIGNSGFKSWAVRGSAIMPF